MTRSPVELIKERLSILEIVGQYVELQKAGKHYKGKSPFTNEKTPSFFVSPERGMYYCFSSQKGGDIFTFIEEMEGVDFKGALKILAERAHVELVPEDPKRRSEREAQYALIEEATQYFFSQREQHERVNAYLAERGVKAPTVHAWRIGYAPDAWRSLRSHLGKRGHSDDAMLKAGLIKRTEGGKEPYDVFRDRIMFPIFDSSGRVVAFSGRMLKAEEGIPKYVNTPETELYQKSEILYGYDKAKQGIRHYDFSLVVEGQFDLVLAHQAGYTNAIAVSGTAFTPHHLGLLQRLSSRAVLALDSDRAGIAAVKRAAILMLRAGMDVKVARMEGGKDPADIIKADPKDFKRLIGQATHVVEFLIQTLKENTKDERAFKLSVREELVPVLVAIENRIDREHFETRIAEATGTTKDAIHFEVGRMESEIERGQGGTDATSSVGLQQTPDRKRALAIHLHAFCEAVRTEHSWLAERVAAELARHVDERVRQSIIADDEHLWQRMLFEAEEEAGKCSEHDLIRIASDRLTEFAHLTAREQLRVLRARMREAEQGGEQDLLMEYLAATKAAEELLQSEIRIDKP